ncbi:MAG: hypothetical protein NZ700_02420 [Gemmataceae bacterium]|nr:hypothetical protein [Gemmataceae bacterium]MDW8264687.1 hypothetical protein [Gemmataceae bacterium]
MIRRSLLASVLLFAGVAAADNPPPAGDEPPRLKKKERPPTADPADKKSGARETDAKPPETKTRLKDPAEAMPEAMPDDPNEQAKEILARLGKNLRTVERRLAEKKTDEATQDTQREILKDLDALIAQSERPSPSESSSSQSNRSSGRSKAQSQTKRGETSPESRMGTAQRTPAARMPRAGSPEPGTQAGAGRGRASGGELGKLADLYKDVWGHLPEKMRLEMDAFAREKFMPRYQELLKQYYATLAEKGRQKRD